MEMQYFEIISFLEVAWRQLSAFTESTLRAAVGTRLMRLFLYPQDIVSPCFLSVCL